MNYKKEKTKKIKNVYIETLSKKGVYSHREKRKKEKEKGYLFIIILINLKTNGSVPSLNSDGVLVSTYGAFASSDILEVSEDTIAACLVSAS